MADIGNKYEIECNSKYDGYFLEESKPSTYNKQAFERMLLKTPLENNIEHLWIKGNIAKTVWDKYRERQKDAPIIEYHIELTKALILLTENESVKIKITTPKDFVNLTDNRTMPVIKDGVLQAFKKQHLNEVPMSYNTGQGLLRTGQHRDFIREYLREMAVNELSWEERQEVDWIAEINQQTIEPDTDLVDYFILGETEKAEINLDYLKWKLKALEYDRKQLQSKGAPQKNYHIEHCIKVILGTLHRPKPTNDDYRLIYEYCSFFDLIPQEITTNPPFQYIKAVYQQYLKKRKASYNAAFPKG